ncbi:MAG: hypothetical protein U0640_08275 [Phycisphaerales bacterium]
MFSLTRTRYFLSLAFIWATLVTALLPLWHHHHEDACGHEEQECVVCVAALLPSGDGVPRSGEFVAIAHYVGDVDLSPTKIEQAEFLPILLTCGPPRA